ncbi:hypothetical protein TRAPUB_7351 [Trametes pubescens]|uniref:F-box domain-containing protein n=1 Tax=Trametes pubescens TaxID=154538 RepID=A0A1M2W6W4_TRAPU|nr:hypothetical protein TRAPUB_7351 [Trametes pubescens]
MNANEWYLLNIDRQQRAQTLFGTLDQLLLEGTPKEDPGGHTALLNSLRTPCLPRKVDEWLSAGCIARQHSPLAWLPVELLDMVLDELLMRDVVMFAITCKSLLSITKRRVLSVLKALHAPWQNGRLILRMNTTYERADLPAGLFTDAEWERIATAHLSRAVHAKFLNLWGSTQYEVALGRRDPLYHLRRRAPTTLRPGVKGPYGQWNMPSSAVSAKRSEGPSDFRMFSVLWGCAGVAYPEGARVLCNISKGEYIREDTLTVARDTGATLAHALLARIAWSTQRSITVECAGWAKEELRHGSWAGDRVCVVTMDTLPALGREVGPWTDVTDAVDRLLWDIKAADIPRHW